MIIWNAKAVWDDVQERQGTVYAISDQVVMWFTADSGEWRGFPISSLTDVTLDLHRNDTGTIFPRRSQPEWPRDKHGVPRKLPLFRYVEAPDIVYALLTEPALRESKNPSRHFDEPGEVEINDLKSANGHARSH